jgi:hypothetical protein
LSDPTQRAWPRVLVSNVRLYFYLVFSKGECPLLTNAYLFLTFLDSAMVGRPRNHFLDSGAQKIKISAYD